MGLKISCLGWYRGFNINHIYFRLISIALNSSIDIVDINDADIILIGPYASIQKSVRQKKNQIIIYGSGENTRPDYRFCDISLTLDSSTYEGRNVRVPAWTGEFDFFGDNPKATFNKETTDYIQARNKPPRLDSFDPLKKFIAIFSTYEQNRISVLNAIESKIDSEKKIGLLWGNGEPNRSADMLFNAKKLLLNGYAFNLCFENSIAPGYITEKVLHARMAGCLALTYAHPTINKDYKLDGVLNFHDYLDIDKFILEISNLVKNPQELDKLRGSEIFSERIDINRIIKEVQIAICPYMKAWF